MTNSISFSAAFLIGLLGSAHCIGMCGGIMNALSFAMPESQRRPLQALPTLLLYNLGRIFSYAVAGAFIGALGGWLQANAAPLGPTLRIVAGVMLIAMGLYLAGWWRGLVYLEQAGAHVWKYLQPIGNRLMPVTRPWQALLLGTIWGWLPCGLVYSTLTLSAATASWQQSALTMASFGLGTLPVMLLTGAFAHRMKVWIQTATVRNIAALLVIAFGIWTLAWPLAHSGKHQHAQHEQPATTAPSHEHPQHSQ